MKKVRLVKIYFDEDEWQAHEDLAKAATGGNVSCLDVVGAEMEQRFGLNSVLWIEDEVLNELPEEISDALIQESLSDLEDRNIPPCNSRP